MLKINRIDLKTIARAWRIAEECLKIFQQITIKIKKYDFFSQHRFLRLHLAFQSLCKALIIYRQYVFKNTQAAKNWLISVRYLLELFRLLKNF